MSTVFLPFIFVEYYNSIILEKVKTFVRKAHRGQVRKYTSLPYHIHPEKVMALCREYTHDSSILAAALLHDVLEDTPVTKKELGAFLKSIMPLQQAVKTLCLVIELTDVFTPNDYPSLNREERKAREAMRIAKTSSEAQTIRYADIIDNVGDIVRHDPEFGRVFVRECQLLLKKMTDGNPVLRQRAIKVVNECASRLRLLNPN